MADVALDIVREFAGATDSAVRRKGMRALGALPSDEAGALLVDAALDDSDPETGRSAEAVLAALGADECRGATQALERQLVERPGKAYALLGRHRLLGGHIEVAHPSWPLRLRRAASLWNEQRRGRGWRYFLRGVGPAFCGAWLGLVPGALAYGLLDLKTDSETNPFVGLVLACLLVPLIAPWVTPTQLQYDRIAGTASDALYGALVCMGLTAVVWAATRTSPDIIALFVVAPLMVVAARVVVSVVGGSLRIPWLGFLWTVLAAGLAGSLAAWLGIFAVSGLFGYDLGRITVGVASCVFAFALAWMFTTLDKPSKDYAERLAREAAPGAVDARYPSVPWPQPNVRGSPANGIGMIVCALALAMIALALPSDTLVPESALARGESLELRVGAGYQFLAVRSVPIQFDVTLNERGLVTIEGTPAPDDIKAYRIELEKIGEAPSVMAQVAASAQSRAVQRPITLDVVEAKNESYATTRDAGQYRLRVFRTAEEKTAIARVARRASMRFGMGSKAQAKLDIRIELAPEPTIRSPGR